jgi:hypothetical protein
VSLHRSGKRATATKDHISAIPLFDRGEPAQLAVNTDNAHSAPDKVNNVKYNIDFLDELTMMVPT